MKRAMEERNKVLPKYESGPEGINHRVLTIDFTAQHKSLLSIEASMDIVCSCHSYIGLSSFHSIKIIHML